MDIIIIIIIIMIEFYLSFAGNIFDENMKIDDEVIKSSRYNEIEVCVFYLEFAYAAAEANLF